MAQNLQAQQRVEPLPDPFQKPFGTDIVSAFSDDHIAGTACSETHAVDNFVWPGIDLYAIPAGNFPQVFTFCGVYSHLFVDKIHLGHGDTFSDRVRVEWAIVLTDTVLLTGFDFQKSTVGPDTEN